MVALNDYIEANTPVKETRVIYKQWREGQKLAKKFIELLEHEAFRYEKPFNRDDSQDDDEEDTHKKDVKKSEHDHKKEEEGGISGDTILKHT